jgi:hypothetical protein
LFFDVVFNIKKGIFKKSLCKDNIMTRAEPVLEGRRSVELPTFPRVAIAWALRKGNTERAAEIADAAARTATSDRYAGKTYQAKWTTATAVSAYLRLAKKTEDMRKKADYITAAAKASGLDVSPIEEAKPVAKLVYVAAHVVNDKIAHAALHCLSDEQIVKVIQTVDFLTYKNRHLTAARVLVARYDSRDDLIGLVCHERHEVAKTALKKLGDLSPDEIVYIAYHARNPSMELDMIGMVHALSFNDLCIQADKADNPRAKEALGYHITWHLSLVAYKARQDIKFRSSLGASAVRRITEYQARLDASG